MASVFKAYEASLDRYVALKVLPPEFLHDPTFAERFRREAQTIARACGKNHLHNLEPEDLCALTMEAAAMARVPLAGTDWYPGKAGF